ncbi:hypothetical protein, partial [Mesotoga sp. B105.6.4]|uniref:hypothetical protein n=1 Tax=Mesotoga sp. B105.6.4 TaxID=1582224 RepID=UPI000CCDE3B2
MRRIRGKRNEARGKKIKISSLFRPLASDLRLFPRTGSMIWDEGLRTTLHSVQRVFVLKLTADLRPMCKGDFIRPHLVCL